ncbi:MAG TPA: heme ABC transporter ATP-binding protein [Saprospiraceae bacterium]|nr:heme ABC transporter ATP-binding protein [Saprospiraceae bacterium]
MLTVKNITYKVGNKVLLDDVSMDFEPGKLNLIIGPNGAGKSTLIKIICRQLVPVNGSVFYGAENVNAIHISELAKIRSVLSQNIELAFPLSVREVVMMGRYPHFSGKPSQKEETACEEAMRFFDVAEMADRNYMTLSGGEKQRVHFARVISQIWYPVDKGYRYLILDEPLTFLDVYYQFDFMQKVMSLLEKKDMVVIGVVHDLNLAARFAEKIVLLHHGKVLAEGDKHKVLTKENIKAAYKLEPVIQNDLDRLYLYF